jgi:Asp-tRNA(Asn)/Glu-tRNA(Gln) amidotransferase A subunit family amidase
MEPVDGLEYMPAHRQFELSRTKQLSPLDVLKAQFARIEEIGHRINAFTCKHFDEALKAARESEARYPKGATPAPLEAFRSQ